MRRRQTDEELLAEAEALDAAYAAAADFDARQLAAYIAEHGEPTEEDLESESEWQKCWLDSRGRP